LWKTIYFSLAFTTRLEQEYLLGGDFIDAKENMVFYGGISEGKTYLSTPIGINDIHKHDNKIKIDTIASLVNELLELMKKEDLINRLRRLRSWNY
jgi:DNA replication protein DnaC